MPRATGYPITIRQGFAEVKIYRSPSKVKGRKYDSYVVYYLDSDKKPVRLRFNDPKEAQIQADVIAKKLSNGHVKALEFDSNDATIYQEAKTILGSGKQSLVSVVREYMEAQKILGDTPLMEAAKYFVHRTKSISKKGTVSKVLEEFLDAKKRDRVAPVYMKDLRNRLKKFAASYPMDIASVTSGQIDDWLRSLSGSSCNRNNYRRMIVTLFEYAKVSGYLPKGEATAAFESTKIKVASSEVGIFTPEQMQAMLDHATGEVRLFILLGGFAGIRTAEMQRLDWSNIKLEEGHIEIKGKQAKTKSRRIIPITPNLKTWLEKMENRTGKLISQVRIERAVSQKAKEVGIEWVHNGLRHSFGSYRLADIKNAAQVSLEMGNSPQMVFKHYREVVTEKQSKEWWGIVPKE